MKVGLALGGGGARGLAHVGVLKVLEAQKIPIDIICGTSMGSVIGAMYAYEPDASRLEDRVREYYSDHGVKGGWLEFLSREPDEFKKNIFLEMSYYIRKRYMGLVALRRVGLEDSSSLKEPLEDLLVDTDIKNLKIPYAATAINLTDGKDEIFSSGSLVNAVYASSSIEGVFPPLEEDDTLYSDGGPTCSVPVEACRELGADFVIAVYLPVSIQKEEKFANGLEVILRADNIASTKLGKMLLDTADVKIVPDVHDIHWAAFQKIDECIKLGSDAALNAIPNIKKQMRTHRSGFIKLRKYLRSKL